MALKIYYQGESISDTVTVVDSDGNLIDLDTLDDITLKFYQYTSKAPAKTLTLSGSGLEKTDPANGEFKYILNKSDTLEFPAIAVIKGRLILQDTNTDYENNTRYRHDDQELFEMRKKIKS